MKKFLLVGALLFVSAFAGKALADTASSKFGDGVVGSSGKAYRVKKVIFTCNIRFLGTPSQYGSTCHGGLWSGTGTSNDAGTNTLLSQYVASVTTPTIVVDFTNVNPGAYSGLLYNTGMYWKETTGASSVLIIYDKK